MDKVFCTGNQWFIGVWKDSKKTQVRLNKTSKRFTQNVLAFKVKRKGVFLQTQGRFFSNDFMCINCIFIRNRYPSVGLEPPGRGLP